MCNYNFESFGTVIVTIVNKTKNTKKVINEFD